ncbi:SET domain-containing protein [Euphorbia peplus]|nr:SET domain-containing protein [Euphorbia peplus]
MLIRAAIPKPCCSLRRFLIFSDRFSVCPNFSSACQSPVSNHFHEQSQDFLPWLEKKAGVQVSSKLYIGKSPYGRSLFASQNIQTGDCILRVPYSVQIASNSLLPELSVFLDNKIGSVAKLALVLLLEQKVCKEESEWAPYIGCLPQLEEMHSTIFWSRNELEMISPSSVYEETIKQKAQIEEDFCTMEPILKDYPQILRSVSYQDFMHAYAIVKSRAWGNRKTASLIPFADFLNHDGLSEAVVLNDEEQQVSEVIADRDYAAHEEVLIRYGKFSNSTLLLDFGFALPYNIHDQVKIQLDIPNDDLLREIKLEILQKHYLPTVEDDNGINSSWDSFVIKEVKSGSRKGKGLLQSLRAFARVLSCISHEDLNYLVNEAARTDGRLARQALKDVSREIQAHEFLLLRINQIIEEYIACIKELESAANLAIKCKRSAFRKQMALYLLTDFEHGSWQLIIG